MGQFAVLIGILFLIVYGLVKSDKYQKLSIQLVVGLLLAWLSIKPQLTWLFILFFVLYFLRSKSWPALISIIVSLFLLGGLSWLLIPGWPSQLWYQLVNGSDELQLWQPLAYVYAGWLTPSDWQTAVGIGLWLIGFASIFVVAIAWWRGKLSDVLTLAWFAFLTQLLHPLNMPPEQILFLLPLLIWTSPADHTLAERPNKRLTVIVWSLAFVVPYLTLIATFDIVESTLVTAILPLCFLIWLGWLNLTPRATAQTPT